MQTATRSAVTAHSGGRVLEAPVLPDQGGFVTESAEPTATPVAFEIGALVATPHGGAANKFSDNGGAVIEIARVQLIYWGSAWTANPAPSPTSAQVTSAVQSLLRGPYMTGLAQYRQIGRGHLLGATVVTTSNPPNPFTDSDVSNFINGLIGAGTIPGLDATNQNLYLVIMPKGVNSKSAGVIGEHTYFSVGSNNFHFGWITNNGTLNFITNVLSHELAESVTDPEGSAILGVAGTCSGTGWCEIGDVCQSTSSNLHGVTVQSFWSNSDAKCIVPDWPNVQYPYSGTQWTYTLAAHQTVRFFTFNWPEYLFVDWEVVPTTIGSAAQITASVAIQRASGAYNTFWITVTNLTNAAVGIEGRFSVLGVV
jgi:hypothetical protein